MSIADELKGLSDGVKACRVIFGNHGLIDACHIARERGFAQAEIDTARRLEDEVRAERDLNYGITGSHTR